MVFENDKVRVLRIDLPAHAKTKAHAHPANVVVYLTDAHLRSIGPDGKTEDSTKKAGQVVWRTPLTHQTENLGDKAVAAIVVELKGK